MAYTVNRTDEFDEWFNTLTAAEQETFATAMLLLKEKGPVLGRPYVETLKESAYANMKELRAPHRKDIALRAAFAFDPQRNAILLIGGDKHAKRGFYGKLLRKADAIFTEHLRRLRK